jgi:3-hydroxyisobutyrate dehydrogenase-like beta-hydroxyacid dehydrogenase
VVIAGMLEALAEGMVACAKSGVDASMLIDVIQASGFRSPYWDFKGRAMLQPEPELHFAASLMHKDLDLFVRRAEALGVLAPSAERLREVYALAMRADLGDKDIAAVIQVLEVAAGVSVASPPGGPVR